MSAYGMDDWAIEVRSPAEARDFSSNLCVQTGSGAGTVSQMNHADRRTDYMTATTSGFHIAFIF
jgi:hypothetical protein